MITTVYDLRTGKDIAIYTCIAEEAVRCAFAQMEKHDFNTLSYNDRYKVFFGNKTVRCGDYCALLEEIEC